MGGEGGKLLVLVLLTVIVAGSASAVTVVNSKDWVDVYSGMRYGASQGEDVQFVQSRDATRLTKLLPTEPVHVIQSRDQPVSPNLPAILRSRGFTVEEVTPVENANLELAPDSADSFILVEQDYPSAAVASASLAEATGSWVYIVGDENRREIASRVKESDQVTMVGTFNRETEGAFNTTADEKIIDPSRVSLSIKVAREYLKKEDAQRAYIAAGRYLEPDLVSGSAPVLITGTNYVPPEVENFLFEDPSHGLKSTVMIGNQMTSVGKDISDLEEESRKDMSVFIKYGTARGDASSPYALSLFPLPQSNTSLTIEETFYDPVENRLMVTFRNLGDVKLYELTSLQVLSDGSEVAEKSDGDPVFIGGGDTKTVGYSVDLSSSEYTDARVKFSTSFGNTPSNLDSYLTEKGKFSPPLKKPLKVKKIEDSSNVSLEEVAYLEDMDRFRILLKNRENEPAYASSSLLDVRVTGEEKSFSTSKKRVPAGGEQEFYVPTKLDRIDLEQNSQVEIEYRFGEREEVLPHVMNTETELETKSGLISGSFTRTAAPATAGLLLILLSVLYFKRQSVLETLNGVREVE